MFCPKCGNELNDNAKFCGKCGTTLNGEQPPAGRPETPAVPAPVQTAPEPSKTGQPERSKAVIVSVTAFSLILILTGAFLMFIKPGFLLSKDDSSSSVSAADDGEKANNWVTGPSYIPDSTGGDTAGGNESSAAEADVTTAAPESSEETVTETTAATTAVTEKVTTETTTEATTQATTEATTEAPPVTTDESPAENGNGEKEKEKEREKLIEQAMENSTYERPSFDEFEWCYGQSGLVSDPPAGAEVISYPEGYAGGWKAMVIYNNGTDGDPMMRELDNIDINFENDKVTLTIDWYHMEIAGSESFNEEDQEDTTFVGRVTDAGIYASGAAEITVYHLWKADGMEYAVGVITTSDGSPAYLAMVR